MISEQYLTWKTYGVSRSDKAPLVEFVVEGLRRRGCNVTSVSSLNRAPYLIAFETPSGERQVILAYVFYANAKVTNERPEDEHRFQIKYGGNLKSVLEVAVDPNGAITTIFLGIDVARGIFIAADPLLNAHSPMSRSVEFKRNNVEEVLNRGWAVWERDRLPGKSERAEPIADLRTEVLIGGTQDRVLDLISLERMAFGLDPGERHLLADKIDELTAAPAAHPILKEMQLESDELLELIAGTSRLRMAVRGWVAETHLERELSRLSGVTECHRLTAEGVPDISLRWRDSPPILVECKNVLRTTYTDGRPKLDFQRTRASKNDRCSRYYAPSDFQVVAACLHAVTERWEFRFATTAELPQHSSCAGKIANMLAVAEPLFTNQADIVFDKCSH